MEKRNERQFFKKLILYILGVQVLALGLMLMVRCNLGVSVGSSVYYVLSQRFKAITLGVWTYLTHGAVLALMMVILRKIRVFYLASFLTSVFLGYSMDLYGLFLPEAFGSLALRLALLCLGIVIVALGIALNYASSWPAAPFDTFSKEISKHFQWKISRVKTVFDISCLGISCILGFAFFHKVMGIGVGTVISAFTTGILVGLFKKLLERWGLAAE